MPNRIVCLGEILMRLGAPRNELLSQARTLQIVIAGAESNVATSLACLGTAAAMVTVLPTGILGQRCVSELRCHGVDTTLVRFRPGRLGLFFLDPGGGLRAPEVVYDRADSVFARAVAGDFNWPEILNGAGWLHVSGVTPALGAASAELALAALGAASAAGVPVSFDCNFRAKLWERWGGDAAATLRQCAVHAQLLFADERALAMMMGAAVPAGDDSERFTTLARQAFAAMPRLHRIAATTRRESSADEQEISGLLASRDRTYAARRWPLRTIVDRIGSGDAFAAALLHRLGAGADDPQALEFAVAAAALKHSLPGDASLAKPEDINALLANSGFGVRR
jgi:2-dehydro-3-deoxygluconokinase